MKRCWNHATCEWAGSQLLIYLLVVAVHEAKGSGQAAATAAAAEASSGLASEPIASATAAEAGAGDDQLEQLNHGAEDGLIGGSEDGAEDNATGDNGESPCCAANNA